MSYKGFTNASLFNTAVGAVLDTTSLVNFSTNIQLNNFNEGMDDFDCIVNQHDNYGLYLNKTGETIETSSLFLNNNKRFELPGFFTNTIIPYEAHTNNPADGIHCYSFAIDPEKVCCPTGYSSFVK